MKTYQIIAGPARNHSENVWGVQSQPPWVTLGHVVQPGQLIGRKNALNLAVWLLRAIGATRYEVDAAMVEAMQAPIRQGFRAFFGDDEA